MTPTHPHSFQFCVFFFFFFFPSFALCFFFFVCVCKKQKVKFGMSGKVGNETVGWFRVSFIFILSGLLLSTVSGVNSMYQLTVVECD